MTIKIACYPKIPTLNNVFIQHIHSTFALSVKATAVTPIDRSKINQLYLVIIVVQA